MRTIFINILILFIITACGIPAPQVTVTSEVTVTLPPTITFTTTPSFTETPAATVVPTLSPDQQTALDAAKIVYSVTGWEIQPSGEVLGAPEGVTYNVDKGVLTRTYIYEGIELTVDLTINTETPMPEGCIANFEGWCLPARGENQTEVVELARKTYSTAGGYGYEGDGKVGEPLLSRVEAQAILADESKVDMTTREFDINAIWNPYRDKWSNFIYKNIKEKDGPNGWGAITVPVSDGKGGITLKDTTVFFATELEKYPTTIIRYWGADHKTDPTIPPKIMLLDTGDPVPEDASNPTLWSNPTGWSDIFKDPKIQVEFH